MMSMAIRSSLLVLFGLCLLLGGASNGGFEANLLLQVAAILVALLTISASRSSARKNLDPWFSWVILFWLVIVIIQFVPLPHSLWIALPGRTAIADDIAALGGPIAGGFVTLSPYDSLSSIAWALPALCLGLALSFRERDDSRPLATVLVGCTSLAIALGLVQFFGSSDSAAYFYEITNRGLMVGFFANANHMATMLLVASPFLTALVRSAMDRKPSLRRELVLLWLVFAGFIFLAILLVGSLTGYALALPVFAWCCLIIFPSAGKALSYMLLPAVLAGIALIAFTDEGGNVFEEDSASSDGGRAQIFSTTREAIAKFMPVGSGLGTFRDIYDNFEPADAVRNVYINHAHSDYLEILLELGVLGAIGMAAFLGWWAWKAGGVLLGSSKDYMAQAAAIGSGIVLVHSAWDYPLRTAALSAVFALCCIILARTRPPEDSETVGAKRRFDRT